MQDFYGEVVGQLLRNRVLDTRMAVLVVCGGEIDRAVLARYGFRDVVISNIDSRPERAEFPPYEWCYQDAERLTFEDESFDFCLVHSGLHHCHSPHRALLEMYRVARRGLLLFEPYDNLMTRLGVRLNLGQEYEHAGVFCNDCHHGGVGNSDIPNYVYRFTEQEIIKTINCNAPYARHQIRFVHRMRVPWTQLRRRRNKTLYHLIQLARPALKLVEVCAPKQSNNFAALVRKPELPQALHPWLRHDGEAIRLDDRWVASRYH
ncbi:Methyltransferase domain-containing protein [Micromonospora rhizosphaerae]|uniref:Methyltransferase domain-containing protein n=1 Tax=Micromonospora rhizosphaerae TaxID=568872 RepID=A0A1C6SN17_9ACTN|nr:class I SAM-dependent methyltransferase [Micromonospora rhizosphaerae]SCL30803.1 Methyltransferase domain-containing protein [Micromonospora rhizosphaerae]